MFDFKVVPDNGEPFEVSAGSRDVLIFEKTTHGKNLATWRDNPTMGDLYRIAHIAARRTGQFHGDLKEFEESCELDLVDEDEDSDPTQPAA